MDRGVGRGRAGARRPARGAPRFARRLPVERRHDALPAVDRRRVVDGPHAAQGPQGARASDDVGHLASGLGRWGTRLGGHEQLRLRAPRRVRHEARGAEVLVRAHSRPLPVGARPRQPHVGAPRGTGAGLPPRRRSSRGGVLGVARREQRVRARSHPPRVGPRRPSHPPARRRGGHRRGARLGRAHDARRASAPRVAPRPRVPHGGVAARAVQAPRRGHPHGGGARHPGRRRRLRPRARSGSTRSPPTPGCPSTCSAGSRTSSCARCSSAPWRSSSRPSRTSGSSRSRRWRPDAP